VAGSDAQLDIFRARGAARKGRGRNGANADCQQ
jgi:hypothetical protein